MLDSTRRAYLKRIVTGTVGTTLLGSGMASAGTLQPKADTTYVWGRAEDIVQDSTARSTFYDVMSAMSGSYVYFSWGEIQKRSVPSSDLDEFVVGANDNGYDVRLLSGQVDQRTDAPLVFSDRYLSALSAYLDDYSADGVHLDIEPSGNDLGAFLDNYETLLDHIEQNSSFNGVTLSIAWRDWWTQNEMAKTRNVRDHARVDEIDVMAYADAESKVRESAEQAMQDGSNLWGRTFSSKPYVVTVEIQNLEGSTDSPLSFYDEGEWATATVLDNIDSSPPKGNYDGRGIHFYNPLLRWQRTYEV
ncbi:hypothetical protein M0R88_09985 [Halorussus gelatinilyticus]|uniref:Uncharacterized protein n=1 Tax=Halorussus gelatinilyticus TaxID=2937524 RepID=A0A8U0IF81_9EURY|nr:hypothetical protein [Halorussus gelatinilyticus]UPV98861.1 hypothetical protein M0R88_09985 [Halorussus gelatinilyticus]